jgi:predicted O-linked N-acetylglucosamine transferase (SPINDLY family)
LPVVVLAGATHASRADVSMLSNVGLPRLVAGAGDGYVEIAANLATDVPALAALRGGLRDMMRLSPLTDGRSCAQHLENAIRAAWREWCGKKRAEIG